MRYSAKRIAIVGVLALLIVPAAASAGFVADPHSISLGGSAWLTAPREAVVPPTQGGNWIVDGSPATEGPVVDIDLQPLGEESTPSNFDRQIASLFPEGDPATSGETTIPTDIAGAGTISTGAGTPDWFALDLGRLYDGKRHPPGGGGQPVDPTNPVPEPATVILLAIGLLMVLGVRYMLPRLQAPIGIDG